MEIDKSDTFLATGDVNGIVKVWFIGNYCLNVNETDSITTTQRIKSFCFLYKQLSANVAMFILKTATLVCSITAHTDVINSIEFCHRNNSIFVMIASLDCSVSINDLNGNQIGIFGQDISWKLEANIQIKSLLNSTLLHPDDKGEAPTKTSKSSVGFKSDVEMNKVNELDLEAAEVARYVEMSREANSTLISCLNENLNIVATFDYADDAFINDTSLRYNPWSRTILGILWPLLICVTFLNRFL